MHCSRPATWSEIDSSIYYEKNARLARRHPNERSVQSMNDLVPQMCLNPVERLLHAAKAASGIAATTKRASKKEVNILDWVGTWKNWRMLCSLGRGSVCQMHAIALIQKASSAHWYVIVLICPILSCEEYPRGAFAWEASTPQWAGWT